MLKMREPKIRLVPPPLKQLEIITKIYLDREPKSRKFTRKITDESISLDDVIAQNQSLRKCN